MKHETNEQGQTLIYLTQEEWEDYGRQAGYYPEIIKEASIEAEEIQEVETKIEEAETKVEVEETVEALKQQIASLQDDIKQMKIASTENTDSTLKVNASHEFNEENYPNLVAEQDQDGLIGIFAPRP